MPVLPRATVRPILLGLSGLYMLAAGAPASAGQTAAPATAPVHAAAPREDGADAFAAARIGDLAPLRRLLARTDLDPAERALAEAQLAATGFAGASKALARYFALGDRDAERLARAHEIAAETAFAEGRFAEAAEHAGRFLALRPTRPEEEMEGVRRTLGVARILASAPRQAVEARGKGIPVAAVRDKVGLLRIAMASGGATEQAVVDTGANLSVASASAARRLGLTMIEGQAEVGNAVGTGVGVRLGIADRVEVAGASLRNVPFLVLEDSALEFPVPGGYQIDTIVGLPVLRALERVRFGPGDLLAAETPPAAAPGESNLRVVGSDLFADVAIAGIVHPLFLDTGAGSTALSTRFAAARPDLRTTDSGASRGKAGAGGVASVRFATFGRLPVAIGGAGAEMAGLSYELEDVAENGGRYGVLGNDLLRLYESFTLDFRHGLIEVTPR